MRMVTYHFYSFFEIVQGREHYFRESLKKIHQTSNFYFWGITLPNVCNNFYAGYGFFLGGLYSDMSWSSKSSRLCPSLKDKKIIIDQWSQSLLSSLLHNFTRMYGVYLNNPPEELKLWFIVSLKQWWYSFPCKSIW